MAGEWSSVGRVLAWHNGALGSIQRTAEDRHAYVCW